VSKSRPQSHLRYPLTTLFGTPSNVRVLRELFAAGVPLSSSEIARRAGLAPQTARLVLNELAVQRVVTDSGRGRARAFAVAADYPFAGVLKSLFAAEAERWSLLFQELRKVLDDYDVQSAWLYGSVARGQDGTGSDVDIAVVLGNDQQRSQELREVLMDLEDRFQVVISAVLLSAEELAEAKGGTWLADSLADARLLKGDLPTAN
jgi:predicted nucleotidyltransferase